VSYLLFLDESGVDHQESPYEVLAGVAIQDRKLWDLIRKVQQAELTLFGQRYTPEDREAKAKTLLKRKTFRLASQLPPIDAKDRRELACACLRDGGSASLRGLTALAQAKLAYVKEVLRLCAQSGVRAFASIIPKEAPRPASGFLRKDYAYLFERFFYFLEDTTPSERGLVIFDELDRARCHLLIDQMAKYFQETTRGRLRAGRIIPEPFFVHSHLTTAVQVADLVAYLVSWGLRIGSMKKPGRAELNEYAELVWSLRHDTQREQHPITSFVVIEDLRPLEEREGLEAWKAHKKRKGKAGFPAKPPK
jgi:Protein of unknown function (DUF3800)